MVLASHIRQTNARRFSIRTCVSRAKRDAHEQRYSGTTTARYSSDLLQDTAALRECCPRQTRHSRGTETSVRHLITFYQACSAPKNGIFSCTFTPMAVYVPQDSAHHFFNRPACVARRRPLPPPPRRLRHAMDHPSIHRPALRLRNHPVHCHSLSRPAAAVHGAAFFLSIFCRTPNLPTDFLRIHCANPHKLSTPANKHNRRAMHP